MIDPQRLAKAIDDVEEEDERLGVVGRGSKTERVVEAYYLNHPDDPHIYDLRCIVCGQPGTVRVSIDEAK